MVFNNEPAHREIKKGSRLEVMEDLMVLGLIHWRAPMTSGFRCVIPKGTILVVFGEPSPSTPGIGCVPEDRDAFEKRFVPEADRNADKYAGYSFVFTRPEMNKSFRWL
jgi:hypothetical protein